MKTLLIYLAFVLFSIQVFAQTSPVLTIRVVNLTTALGSSAPFGTTIIVASDSTRWDVVNVDGIVGTETVTSALAAAAIKPLPTKVKGSTQISVTGTNGHLVLAVPDGTITNVLVANMATKTFKGRTSTGTGVPEDLSISTVKTDLSINNVDNTTDANKPVSTATQTALDLKRNIADTVVLKGTFSNYDALSKVDITRTITATAPITINGTTSADLSANRTIAIIPATPSVAGSMSAADKTKLDGIAAGAGTGTVTSITMGTGLTGGTITTTGTGAIDTTFVAKKTTVAAMYEPKFAKNTGFNKAFGSTTGTVLEGRTFGTAAASATTDFAPASGSANYIQNQNASAQSANMWIDGTANIGFITTIGTPTYGGRLLNIGGNVIINAGSEISWNWGNSAIWGNFDGTLHLGTWNGSSNTGMVINADQSATFLSTIQATTAKLTNLTDGYLPYHISDANGLDNSGFYWDAVNQRGGIGTTNSGYKLDVAGTLGTNGRATFGDAASSQSGSVVLNSLGTTGNMPNITLKSGGTQYGVMGLTGAILGTNATDVAIFAETGKTINLWTNGGATGVIINTNGSVGVNELASIYARLTSTSPTGQLTAVADGSANQFLKTNAVGGYTWAGLGDAKLTYSGSFTFSNDNDLVPKSYVDAVASGNLPKLPVDAATTGNVTLSGASQTIDGFAAIAGSRILVWKQTTASENGVYIVASGAWTRATDLDTWAELYKAYVAVIEGYQNGSSFVCTIPSTGTLETTDVTWVLYGVPTNIVAGTGMSKVGNILSTTITQYTDALARLALSSTATGLTYTNTTGVLGLTSGYFIPTTATLSGTNTGDNAVNSNYSGLVSNATHTGDATGATALTVVKINGVALSGLATGLLKNTTATGVPSIAVEGTDYLTPSGSAALLTSFPTLNQNTTGNAATVTTNANLTGEVTSTGNAATVTNSAVIGKVLTGYTSGAGTVSATDNILQAIQKLNGNAVASTHSPVTIGTANGLSLSTQALSLALGSTSTTGAISSTDWNTFNNKLATNGSAAGLTSFPTLNQNTTGTAANITGIALGANGGTGIANTGKTITIGGNLTTSGAYASTFTMTGTTGVTFPTSGTLATTAQITGTNSGTNTGDVSFIIQYFTETATSSVAGVYHQLAHTPESTSTGIQVIYNGTPIPSTQFTYTAGSPATVQVTGQVYANDRLAISYLYK